MRQFGPGGKALKRRYFTEEGELLADDEVVRGYEVEEGKFIVVTDEELEKLEPRKSRDIDLRRFVGRDEIPANLFERHYVLAPGGESTKAYHLLAEAMEREGRAGIATYVMRGREYLVAIYAERGLLFGATLRFVDQLRTPESIGLPEVSAAPAKALKEVKAALKACLANSLDTKLFVDEESDALLKLAQRKEAKSRDLIEVEAGEDDDDGGGDDILDIMAILKQRMQGGSTPKAVGAGTAADGNLSNLSKADLYDRAKDLDIPGRSAMSRADLEKAIKAAG